MRSDETAQTLRQRDADARARAQRCFDRPLVIEAGAGTGKTAALVARIVAWAMGPGWERSLARAGDAQRRDRIAADLLSRMAAITFTDAAAAEMAERVGEALVEIERGAQPQGLAEDTLPAEKGERRARARALLGALDHLVVRTIHAWCHGLLARHPLEAGLHPAFQVDAEGRARAEAIRAVLESALVAGYAEPGDPQLLALAAEGIGPPELEEALRALVEAGVTSAALERDPLSGDSVQRHMDRLIEALDAFRA